MSGVLQAVFQNQRSFGEPAPTVIGQAYGGGFYAGMLSTVSQGDGTSTGATHYLVVGPVASAQSTLAWKNANTITPGADDFINGSQNTADMVADGDSTVYPAAHFCNNLVTGGYSDWYMPSLYELDICYNNLKPTTGTNSTSGTSNTHAIPSRGNNYTSGIPAQTSATAFKTGNAEAFQVDFYWSSTEGATTTARPIYFDNGNRPTRNKDETNKVRAVRRVPI
jgi:hypothetical protein